MSAVANSSDTMDAKVATRKSALEWVGRPSSVFDAYCGKGGMRDLVWGYADKYVGCDKRYEPFEDTYRFVGDNRVVMRSIPLAPYNVFDLDAFGSPWECALIIAARRQWALGERGAVIVTDGSGGKMRFGGKFPVIEEMTGIREVPALPTAIDYLHTQLCESFCERADVVLHKLVSSRSTSGKGGGGQVMYFTAILFEG